MFMCITPVVRNLKMSSAYTFTSGSKQKFMTQEKTLNKINP